MSASGFSTALRLMMTWVSVIWLTSPLAQAAPPDPMDFAREPEVSRVVVSPGNRYAAMRVKAPNDRLALAVVDLHDLSQRRVIASYDDVDVREIAWVNDRRLVYQVRQPGYFVDYEGWGTMTIDVDGDNEVHLISARSDNEAATGSQIRTRVLPRFWRFWKTVGDGSDDVYVTRWADSGERGVVPKVVARVNTRTLRLTELSDGQPDGADGWWFDATGRLAVVTTTQKDQRRLWWKPRDDTPWQVVHEWSLYGEGYVQPRMLERDGTLVVEARQGRDTAALYTFDLAKGRLDPQPLAGVEHFDVGAVHIDHRAMAVIGVSIDAHQTATLWFDEGLARVQAAVDKALPSGRSNVLLCGHCVSAKRFIIHSSSDRHPGEYLLFDTEAGKLVPLAAHRPWIAESGQGPRSYHRVAARDGLTLPVVVTHPPDMPRDRPLPTVMLVHGGPWAPGATLKWEAEPAYLASLGYRVLQVSFRGTTGLGWKHERASWGEFGQAMQDDLEDALLWAIREKLSDPERVCIYGASYGGYAALMGPVRHPGRYRCAVSHVGVTDLTLMFSRNWTDISPAGRQYGWARLVGDPQRDADRLQRQSPVNRVKEINVPLLVAQGRHDRRVAPEHADRFVSAARAAGVSVERVDYEEGHGFSRPDNQADFWRRLASFLGTHLTP